MIRRNLLRATFAAAALLAVPVLAQTVGETTVSSAKSMGTVPVGNVEIYYEVHGDGAPLVLLHGGVNPSDTFGAPLTALAKRFKVIAVHLRGHGYSTDSHAPWSAAIMADDVVAVLEHLAISKASFMGYSLGAAVSLQIAIRHPEIVDKLVSASVAFRTDGNYPEVQQAFAQMPSMAASIGEQLATSPLADLYPDINWETMIRKSGEMNMERYDWSADLAKLEAPTLLVFADADSIRPEHAVGFWSLLGGGQRDAGVDGSQRPVHRLAILPGTSHYNLIQSPLLIEVVTAFLDP